jgi:hypothetical protein
MRSLTDQAQALLQAEPPADIPPAAIAVAVKMLVDVARQLDHLQYFALQDEGGGWWLMDAPSPEGQSSEFWLPAFSRQDDARAMQAAISPPTQSSSGSATPLTVVPIDTIRLLFLGMGLQRAKGLLFYEAAGDGDRLARNAPVTGKTVQRSDLQQQLQQWLRRALTSRANDTIA